MARLEQVQYVRKIGELESVFNIRFGQDVEEWKNKGWYLQNWERNLDTITAVYKFLDIFSKEPPKEPMKRYLVVAPYWSNDNIYTYSRVLFAKSVEDVKEILDEYATEIFNYDDEDYLFALEDWIIKEISLSKD